MMKFLRVALFAFSMLVLGIQPVFAVSLVIDEGELIGVDGIYVDGIEYDVRFVEGSFEEVFYDSVNNVWELAFTDIDAATAASQALLDYVYVDEYYDYDFNPDWTYGITDSSVGYIFTPYDYDTATLWTMMAMNYKYVRDRIYGRTWSYNLDTSNMSQWVFAKWSEASSPVPEPANILLLCTGLCGVAGSRRAKKRR